MARTRAPAHRVDLAPLVTQRLLLRSFQRGDLVAVERLASDPRVREHAPLESRAVDVARDADSTPAMQRFARASRRKHADEIRAVVVRRTGKLIGACDITRLSRREADIGYMLARRHWGHGYATELVEAVLTHAFSTLGLSRVTAVVAIDNERSRHVLAKNGFQWQELIRS
jgi:RimJ/RimL family protein N-acetyltransferase